MYGMAAQAAAAGEGLVWKLINHYTLNKNLNS
jgi:hypothetical protein